MSEAPRPPAEPTEQAVSASSVPPAASSDSAPPPTAPHPAPVPPRNYSSGPVYLAAPPAYAPNSSVPTFLRALAALVFIGGSVGAAVAWVYKSVIYPRLLVALKARTRLFTVHEAAYSKLFDALKSFTASTGIARLGGAEAIEFRRNLREEEAARVEAVGAGEGADSDEAQPAEKQPLLEKGEPAGEGEGAQDAAPQPQLPPPPQLLAPVTSSLSSLNAELKAATAPSSFSTSSTNPSNLVQPQGTLMRSLVTLNEYLESETYTASTFHTYRPYGAYGTTGASTATGERKALQEVTHNVKADIRSLKGALLNRRSFVRSEVPTSA
ncbi:hypothetical protein JCM10449v2_004284 [Rhodotorula kratochvilovae]